MKATLTAEVQIRSVTVPAEVALWERRPDLQALCAAARKRPLDGACIEEVLPGLSPAARENIARHARYLRLSDVHGRLTPLGESCAARGLAPMWEQGVYSFLVALHPCFGTLLLDLRPEPAHGQDREGFEDLPDWFAAAPEAVIASAVDQSTVFTVHDLLAPRGQTPPCRLQALPPGRLDWTIDLESGANTWRVSGQVPGGDKPLAYRSPGAEVPRDELEGLLASWDDRYDDASGRVLVAWDGNTALAAPFERDVVYRTAKVGRRGSFSDVRVQGVPVGPQSPDEGRKWALALALSRLEDRYVTPHGWSEVWRQVVRGTPLDGVAGRAPPIPALLKQPGALGTRPRWLLAAAHDVAMEVSP